MIERQLWNIIQRKPLCLGGIVTTLHFRDLYQGEMGNRDDAPPRIPIDSGKGPKLLDIGIFESCLLIEFPLCPIDCILVHLQITAGKCPHSLEGRNAPFNEQYLQNFSVISEDDAVCRDGRPRKRIYVLAFFLFHGY